MQKKKLDISEISSEKANIIILQVLTLVKDYSHIDYQNWPYDDLSVNDIFNYLRIMYDDPFLKNEFITYFTKKLDKKKQFKSIEGFFSLIKFFEYEERYEDCVILKNLKDNLLFDMELSS